MATAQEVMIEDLPPELLQEKPNQSTVGIDWERALRSWARDRLSSLEQGDAGILHEALPRFERIMIQEALETDRRKETRCLHTSGMGTKHPHAQNIGPWNG